MPEMPEVEVMTERLQEFVGYQIVTADGRGGDRYLPQNEKVFVTEQMINGIFRRGKMIIFMLDRGAILCHNAMSGYWDSEDDRWTFDYVEGKRTSKDSDIRCDFLLCNGDTTKNLFFHDARKFGYLRYLEPDQLAKKLSKVGPEAIKSQNLYEPAAVMDENSFVKIVRSSDKTVKEILMDQNVVAGVGNIYAAEACWYSHVNPFTIGRQLGGGTASLLYHCVVFVLEEALRRHLDYGNLKVYRRKFCPNCKSVILSEKLKGRNTWWCGSCQS